MKAQTIFLVVFLSMMSNAMMATSLPQNWEEMLRVELNKAIGNESFSFEALDVQPSVKKITGTGTFFGTSGVQFQVTYLSNQQIGSFSAQLPSDAGVGVSSSEITQLVGQPLKDFVPSAISKAVHLSAFGFTFSKEKKAVERIDLQFNCLDNWQMLQYSHLKLDAIQLEFRVDQPSEKTKRTIKGKLLGKTKIGGVDVDVLAALTKGKKDIQLKGLIGTMKLQTGLKSIANNISFVDFPVPNALANLDLKNTELTLAPHQDWVLLVADSNLGRVKAFVQKNEPKKKGEFYYVVVVSPPKNFKLSQLNNKLKVLDGLDVSNQTFVISSEKKKKSETSKIPSLAQIKSGISKGVSMVMKLDVRKLKLEHLIKAKEFVVSSPLTAKLDHIVLETELGTPIEFSPTMKLQKTYFRLKPSTKDFQVSILGTMDTKIEEDQLEFKGGVEVVLTDQTINFVSMLEGDWNNPLGAKGLVMEDVGMQLGASLAGGLPNVAIRGGIKIGKFNGAAAVAFDSRNPSKSMMQVSFNKLVYWDLIEMLIDKKVSRKIPKELKKTLRTLFIKDAEMEVVPFPVVVLDKSYDAGFRVAGGMEILGTSGFAELDIDYSNGILAKGSVDPIDLGTFKLTGVKGKKRPGLTIDLRKGKDMKIVLNGLVSLMGVSGETDIEVLPNGFRFKLGGKLFNVFNGQITASGADLAKAGDMQLKVKMNNDILGFIDREVTKVIENSTGGAIKKLTGAQKTLSEKQRNVNALDKEINAARKEVRAKQQKSRVKYDTAKRALKKCEKKVNSLNRLIRKYKKELKGLKKTQVARKTWLVSKIASLNTSKKSAVLALKGAQKVMDGLKWVNQDPDKSAKVAAIITKKHTAVIALEAAKKSLEALKLTLGAVGKTGTFIMDKGTDGLVNIKKVDFAGRLGTVSGGAVKLNMDLEWMKKRHKIKFNFNLKDPAQSIKALSKKLMDL